MRVAIAAYDAGSSGIASYTLELAKLLSKELRVTLVSFDGEPDVRGVDVLPIRLRGRSRALPLLAFIRNEGYVEEALEGFDLVHETLPPWGSPAENLVTTRWGYTTYLRLALIRLAGLSFPENLGAIPVTLQHYLMDRASRRRARHMIDVSRATPNFVPPPMEPGPIRNYQCSCVRRILFVSRDLSMPRKNLRVVVEAMRRLKGPAELHLVGDGRPPTGGVRMFHHGRLPREQVLALMREMDLLVLPSTYEELGFVGLEAYSVGLPVVASDIPSFRAIFRASPKFPPRDSGALARILDSLTCEELEELGRRGREQVIRDNEVARRLILGIYKSVLQLRGPRPGYREG
ncbi:MAG: glycosyltransferase family 4 protein [Conexivisphaera sp.]